MRERGEGRVEQLVTSWQGPRRRWLGPFLSLASGALMATACANPSNSSEAGRMPSQSEPGKPQQVVQRIAPTPAPAAPNATAGSTAGPPPNGGAGPKEADERGAAARPGAETLTAKHVEAELNRLEAELK